MGDRRYTSTNPNPVIFQRGLEYKKNEERNYKITRVSARRTRLPAMHKKSGIEIETASNALEDDSVIERLSIKDYLEQTKDLIKSDGGPPRWFSPLECGARWENSPLLLYLPGIDGVGLGLIMHHQKLGKIFDIWCLHIPVMDRTPFIDLVQYVKKTVQSENSNSPCRPIYLIGESFGGCLALAVASRNPDIDLMLILANPATSFRKSPLQALLPLLEVIPEQLNVGFPSMLNFITGDALTMVITSVKKGIPIQQTVQELSEGVAALFPSLSVLSDILPGKSILWKLRMLQSASSFANSRLHAVKSEVLILASGRDQLLPSKEEAERLGHLLPSCQIRNFKDSAHTLFLKEGADLVTVIKSAGFYRRTRNVDYVADFIKPTTSEFRKASESYRWFDVAASPMMLSTLENGRIVKGLAGIPFEGPVLLVGYHMLLGLEISPLIYEFWGEKNIKLRGMVHPRLFEKELERCLHGTTPFDIMRILGGVPVSAPNFYRLLSKKSHIFLYPGGSREALHRKGEEYKLFWPPQSEFVRMAARFGAKIVPFGVVGIDDMFDLFLDCNDQMKIPYFKAQIEHLNGGRRIRTEATGQFAKQVLHIPGVMPKLPGRFYFLFGKPIETEVRKEELRNREEAHELYMHIKHEVENCIGYLKEKREKDPYRSLASRILYKAIHGFESKVPTFEL
ncbi:hypothetical protein GIB67_009463 [Kingdonia uniflora]|uniref:Serine aminopeptidase S33 domain-containing protein n=1 Tax=Kingdonia uniflora TaxID=39325 RepID=A0A7J7N3E0_9MAGN|nr:hypothetical protein GIB67_009463 [Kingdonia uniflora]